MTRRKLTTKDLAAPALPSFVSSPGFRFGVADNGLHTLLEVRCTCGFSQGNQQFGMSAPDTTWCPVCRIQIDVPAPVNSQMDLFGEVL